MNLFFCHIELVSLLTSGNNYKIIYTQLSVITFICSLFRIYAHTMSLHGRLFIIICLVKPEIHLLSLSFHTSWSTTPLSAILLLFTLLQQYASQYILNSNQSFRITQKSEFDNSCQTFIIMVLLWLCVTVHSVHSNVIIAITLWTVLFVQKLFFWKDLWKWRILFSVLMLQSRFFLPWCSGSFFGRSDSLMTPLSAVWISSYLMQLCLRFCFWILQSQISTVYGIRNLYCSASLSHWSVSEFPQDFPICWNREIFRANLSSFLPEQCCNPWNCNYPESLRKRRNGTTYDHRKCAAL